MAEPTRAERLAIRRAEQRWRSAPAPRRRPVRLRARRAHFEPGANRIVRARAAAGQGFDPGRGHHDHAAAIDHQHHHCPAAASGAGPTHVGRKAVGDRSWSADVPRQPDAHLSRRGSRAVRADRALEVPRARDVLAVERVPTDHDVVRERLDRSARRVRARRSHVGRVRCVRPQGAFPRRADRRAHPPRFRDGRHHQGKRHRRPRRLPTRVRRLARRLPPRDSNRPAGPDGAVEAQRARCLPDTMERRLGRLGTRPR